MTESMRKYKKFIKVGLIIFIAILSLIYLKVFFQEGIIYNEVFLIREESPQGSNFQGKSKWGKINIITKGDYLKDHKVSLEYKLPNGNISNYDVEFNFDERRNMHKIKILDNKGNNIFNGFYISGSSFYLLDEAEEIVFPETINSFLEYEPKIPYNSTYKITPYNIVGLATQNDLDIRGDYPSLFFAIVLLTITFIDVKYPLFFFNLDTFLNIKDAEPSEFYLKMQRIRWLIFPLISLVLLISSIV